MAYNQFSNPIAGFDFQAPIPLELIAQGSQTKGKRAENFISENQGVMSNLFGITTYGKDAEALQEIEQNTLQQINQISQGDISSPQTQSRIRTLLNQVSSNPDVLAIHKRAGIYNKEQSLAQKALEKGQNYISPALESLNQYYSGNEYYRNPENLQLSTGFVAPEVTKKMDEWIKNSPEMEQWVKSGGYWKHEKGKTIDNLYNVVYNGIESDPSMSQYYDYMADKAMEGYDLNAMIDNPSLTISQLLPNLPPEAQAQAIEDFERLQSIKDTPYFKGFATDRFRTLYKQNEALKAAQTKYYLNTTDIKVDEYAKAANDFALDKQLAQYKKELDVQYPKEGDQEVLSLVEGLEQFKKNRTGIPGIFTTDIFKKEISKPEESVEYEYDSEGNPKIKKSVVKATKSKNTPIRVGYRDFDDTFTIGYEDGTVEKLTTQQVLDKVAASKPALTKYLKTDKSTQDPLRLF